MHTVNQNQKILEQIPPSHILRLDRVIAQDVYAGLQSRGVKPQDAFLKCANAYYDEYWQGSNLDMGLSRIATSWNKHKRIVSGTAESIESEFAQLVKIFSVIPENVVMPFALVLVRDNIVGYFAEFVGSQRTLENYCIDMNKGVDDQEAIKRYIKLVGAAIKAITKMHTFGIGHGDLEMHNIMVTQRGEIKLIDPLSCFDDDIRIKEDRDILYDYRCDVSKLKSSLRASFSK